MDENERFQVLKRIADQFRNPEKSAEERAGQLQLDMAYKPKNPFAPRATEMSPEETAEIKAKAAAIRQAREGARYNPKLAELSGVVKPEVTIRNPAGLPAEELPSDDVDMEEPTDGLSDEDRLKRIQLMLKSR